MQRHRETIIMGYCRKVTIGLLLCMFGVLPIWAQSEHVPRSMIHFAETVLTEFGKDPVIVEAVQAQNNENIPLTQIKETDREWIEYDGMDRFMMDKISNDCALRLWNFQLKHRYIMEIFVMDDKGATVGQTNKTSDYWQGDEAKFTESYNNGKGALQYGEPEYDISADELVVQISVPVITDNRAIGAITFGISLDGWERR